MKNKDVIQSSDGQLELVSYVKDGGVVDFDDKNKTLAEILRSSRNFTNEIIKIRAVVGLAKKINYPTKPTSRKIIRLIVSLTSGQSSSLNILSSKLLNKYRLGDEWFIPLEIAVLTHKLMLPPKVPNIKLHTPAKWLGIGKERRDERDASREFPWARVMDCPAIYFTHHIKIGTLLRWLENKKNVHDLEQLLNNLPKIQATKKEDYNIFLGRLIHTYKLEDNSSHDSDIAKKINKLKDDNRKFSENDSRYSESIADLPINLTGKDIQKCYERFIETLEELI